MLRILILISLKAGPGFSLANETHRLNKNDATYVECIHTNWKCFGFKEPFCTSDFYPNGGYTQPGCSSFEANTCDHSRSIELFADSLRENNFEARQCDSQIDFGKDGQNLNACNGFVALMGGEPGNKDNSNARGVFYLETRDSIPFSLLSPKSDSSALFKLKHHTIEMICLISFINLT